MRRYEVLEKLIKEHGWTYGAEIGVFKGTTFFYLLDNCPGLDLIGVDAWLSGPELPKDTNKGISSFKPQELLDKYAETVKAGAEKRDALILHGDSVKAATFIPDGVLDFVFIDADHSEAGVLADVRAWAPKVRKGGWILGHDEQWPSVRRALTQLFDKWTVHQDNVWSVP